MLLSAPAMTTTGARRKSASTPSLPFQAAAVVAGAVALALASQVSIPVGALAPITLTLDDYAGTEKISNLPRKLSTAGAPAGSDPSVGDIAYYTY